MLIIAMPNVWQFTNAISDKVYDKDEGATLNRNLTDTVQRLAAAPADDLRSAIVVIDKAYLDWDTSRDSKYEGVEARTIISSLLPRKDDESATAFEKRTTQTVLDLARKVPIVCRTKFSCNVRDEGPLQKDFLDRWDSISWMLSDRKWIDRQFPLVLDSGTWRFDERVTTFLDGNFKYSPLEQYDYFSNRFPVRTSSNVSFFVMSNNVNQSSCNNEKSLRSLLTRGSFKYASDSWPNRS